MHINKTIFYLILIISVFFSCTIAYALPLSGYAQSDITNISVTFSDATAVSVSRKGMYPSSLNGTHANSFANDMASGATQTQRVENGYTLSSAGKAYSLAGLSYTDIASNPFSNTLYNGVNYSASASGSTDLGSSIHSYAVINDHWLFTATAPVTVAISFDFVLSASGKVSSTHGNLLTDSTVGLGVGRNNTTWYDGEFLNSDLLAGTLSMDINYHAGDIGNIFIWHSASVISSQSLPAPVPEPSAILLFGAGLVGIVSLRKKLFNNSVHRSSF